MTLPRKFSLVLGCGEGGEPSATLTLVPPPTTEALPLRRAVQLTIPAVTHNAETLVSIGTDGLLASNLERLLGATHARHVVDIRASPSFPGHRSGFPDIFRVLSSCRVTYQHIPELANPYIAESWADTGSLDKYREHLRTKAQPFVTRLRAQLKSGPVIVLSRPRRHDGSERACVVDELARVNGEFDLTIADW